MALLFSSPLFSPLPSPLLLLIIIISRCARSSRTARENATLVARVAPRTDAAEGLARALVARCARSSRTARKSATLVARVAHVILVSGAPAQTYNNHTKLWLCGLSYSLQPSSAHNAATGAPGASGGVIKKTQ